MNSIMSATDVGLAEWKCNQVGCVRGVILLLKSSNEVQNRPNWLKVDLPTIDEWADIVYEIYVEWFIAHGSGVYSQLNKTAVHQIY